MTLRASQNYPQAGPGRDQPHRVLGEKALIEDFDRVIALLESATRK
jgi:hypothetical protein